MLRDEYAPRGVNLVKVNGKWTFRTANALEPGMDRWVRVNLRVKAHRLLGIALAVILVGQRLSFRSLQQGVDPSPQGFILLTFGFRQFQRVQGAIEQRQAIDTSPLRSAEQQVKPVPILNRLVPLAVPGPLRIRPVPGGYRP